MMTSIRLANSVDVDRIAEIDAELYGANGYQYFTIKQYLDLFHNSFFVADSSDELIGYCVIGVEAFTRQAWLLSIAVCKAAQHQGVGRALMEAAEEYCIKQQIDACKLTVHPENEGALSLYEHFGYCIEKNYSAYYKEGDPRVLMTKHYANK